MDSEKNGNFHILIQQILLYFLPVWILLDLNDNQLKKHSNEIFLTNINIYDFFHHSNINTLKKPYLIYYYCMKITIIAKLQLHYPSFTFTSLIFYIKQVDSTNNMLH